MRAHWLHTPKSSMLLLCLLAVACAPNQFVSMGSDGEVVDVVTQDSSGGSCGSGGASDAANGACTGGVSEAAAGSGIASGFGGGGLGGVGASAGANPLDGVSGTIFRLPMRISSLRRN
jgi:hypothetical protein